MKIALWHGAGQCRLPASDVYRPHALAAPERLPQFARVNTDTRLRLGVVGSILMPTSLHDPAPISVDGVHRSYGGRATPVHALRGISLAIHQGERLALLGKSASGKSTLLNLLGGLDRPTSGRITVGRREIGGMTRDELAEYRLRTVGMVFQAYNLIPSRTALENAELPMIFGGIAPRESRLAAQRALTAVGLEARFDHLPSELSGGEHQRVAIARALINSPAILLADEPTGNLDSTTAGEVMEIIQRHLRTHGTTLIMVTHDSVYVSSSFEADSADVPGDTLHVKGIMTPARRTRLRQAIITRWNREHIARPRALLTETQMRDLGRIPHVTGFIPASRQTGKAALDDRRQPAAIASADTGEAGLRQRIVAGRLYTSPSERSAVVHEHLVYAWGITDEADVGSVIGRTIQLSFGSGRRSRYPVLSMLTGGMVKPDAPEHTRAGLHRGGGTHRLGTRDHEHDADGGAGTHP